MKHSSNRRNKPRLPKNAAQSQKVGTYNAQLEGTKSRCRLVATITNRSTHIPRFADNATKKSSQGVVRIFRDQSNCGITQLSAIKVQKTQPYGPKARFF